MIDSYFFFINQFISIISLFCYFHSLVAAELRHVVPQPLLSPVGIYRALPLARCPYHLTKGMKQLAPAKEIP